MSRSLLDSGQIIKSVYDEVEEAIKITGEIDLTEQAIGQDGSPAPADLKMAGGVDGSGNVQALRTDSNGELQVDVLSSALPTGAATAALQTTGNTALSALSAKTAAGLVPEQHDETVITYVGATTDIDTVTYKLGGVTVATLTMSYDGSNRLSGVVKS